MSSIVQYYGKYKRIIGDNHEEGVVYITRFSYINLMLSILFHFPGQAGQPQRMQINIGQVPPGGLPPGGFAPGALPQGAIPFMRLPTGGMPLPMGVRVGPRVVRGFGPQSETGTQAGGGGVPANSGTQTTCKEACYII